MPVSLVPAQKKAQTSQHSPVDQGGLMHTDNSSVEQQREMFVSSEHIQIDIITVFFSLKIRTFL